MVMKSGELDFLINWRACYQNAELRRYLLVVIFFLSIVMPDSDFSGNPTEIYNISYL